MERQPAAVVTLGGGKPVAGLQPRDVITHLGDTSLSRADGLRRYLGRTEIGSSVHLRFLRRYAPMEAAVQLAAAE
jgi:S1-C subfamily serine protease